LRRGEAIALRWEDVNLAKGTITIVQSYTRRERGHIFQEPKTKAGIRTITLPQITIEALKKQKVLLALDKLAAGAKYNDYALVTQTKADCPISPCYLNLAGGICYRIAGIYYQQGLQLILLY